MSQQLQQLHDISLMINDFFCSMLVVMEDKQDVRDIISAGKLLAKVLQDFIQSAGWWKVMVQDFLRYFCHFR